ncbi:4749_t:CDS:10 [Ambispora leptoticha]|uniref:Spindle pole body component n=1 Tax=Ambispora leptoticha TaxID=144679 RepID=A0A9N9F9C9_9GLOM|nr:4749_t:CDS:10 [Ambispora leptoticha]
MTEKTRTSFKPSSSSSTGGRSNNIDKRISYSSAAIKDLTNIGSLSLQLQEYAIIEDLLFVMMGIEGKYIYVSRSSNMSSDKENRIKGVEYVVDKSLDISLKELTERIIPLATYYTSIDAFIEMYSAFEYGFVNHALCAAIKGLLKEYLILITQLEHQFRTSPSFTLQKFWFHVHPTLHTMSNIHSLVMEIHEVGQEALESEDDEMLILEEFAKKSAIPEQVKGGGILGILAERLTTMSGDPGTKKLYIYLLSKASQPYVSMLHTWIHHGEIQDPYEEFMIQERKNVRKENLKEDFNDSYWEQRYTPREGTIPPFLTPFKNKILLAGKYLNVIRECGIPIEEPKKENDDENNEKSTSVDKTDVNVNSDVLLAMDGGKLVESIEIAYKRANRTLLDQLLKGQQLLARLRSIKRYFFLDQSDFFTHFLDLASTELKKPSSQVSLTKLQSLLDLVLRNPSSVAYADPFKEDVKVEMSSVGLVDQLLRIINVAGMAEPLPTSTFSRGPRETFNIRKESGRIGEEIDGDGYEDADRLGYAPSLAGSVASSLAGSITGSSNSGGGKQALTGIEALSLDYTVTFPLSLVISRKALTKYQLLFRHILYLKHVEQILCSIWTEHFKSYHWRESSGHLGIEAWKNRLYVLRQRMLVFIQQFAYYVTNEVLEPQWRTLEANFAKVSTVDQVLEYHTDFLDTCLKECMLTNAKLLRIYSKLVYVCVLFANYTDKFTKSLISLKNQLAGINSNTGGNNNTSTVSSPSLQTTIEQQERTLSKFEDNFVYHVRLLIDALNFYSATETVQFLCLVVRLDYNQHYSQNSVGSAKIH